MCVNLDVCEHSVPGEGLSVLRQRRGRAPRVLARFLTLLASQGAVGRRCRFFTKLRWWEGEAALLTPQWTPEAVAAPAMTF